MEARQRAAENAAAVEREAEDAARRIAAAEDNETGYGDDSGRSTEPEADGASGDQTTQLTG